MQVQKAAKRTAYAQPLIMLMVICAAVHVPGAHGQCLPINGVDLPFSDISSNITDLIGYTPATCCAKCGADPDCKLAVYGNHSDCTGAACASDQCATQNCCWLKSAGVLQTTPVPQRPLVAILIRAPKLPPYTVYINKTFGPQLYFYPGVNVSTCQALCEAYTGQCFGFAVTSNGCQLQKPPSSNSLLIPADNVTLYLPSNYTPTQPPTTADASGPCVPIKDTDFPGDDITGFGGMTGYTPAMCCAKCHEVAGCKLFAYGSYADGSINNACWLKSAVVNFTRQIEPVSSQLITTYVPASTSPPYVPFANKTIGQDSYFLDGLDASTCQALCEAFRAVCFAFVITANGCQLKYNPVAPNDKLTAANGTLYLPSNSGFLPTAGTQNTSAPNTTTAAAPVQQPTSATSSAGGKLGGGAIAGIVVGAVLGLVLLTAVIVLLVRRKRRASEAFPVMMLSEEDDHQITHNNVVFIPGLEQGELFTRETAHAYQWVPDEELLAGGKLVALEAGINDMQADSMQVMKDGQPYSPVVQLSRQQLCQNVKLLTGGLLGKGGSALVFKCVWPSRFGQHVLAAKVLKDGYGACNDEGSALLTAFAYEAQVLTQAMHPNIVKLYGYCLEPPTVCLLLELLPYSLKDLLYSPKFNSTMLLSSSEQPTNSTGIEKPATDTHTASNSSGFDKSVADMKTATNSSGFGKSAADMKTATNNSAAAASADCVTPSSHLASSYGLVDAAVTVTPLQYQGTSGSLVSPSRPVRRLPEAQVLRISADVAAGLAYLHEKHAGAAVLPAFALPPKKHVSLQSTCSNRVSVLIDMKTSGVSQRSKIVHRDLKPANILLNSQGRAKISDFGLAREHTNTTVRTVHIAAGTLPYMAPELLDSGLVQQRDGPSTATNRLDVYSLGIMMWEMLAGERPWRGLGEAALVAAVLNGQRPPLSDIATGHESALTQQQLADLIKACWAQQDTARPPAALVRDKLDALLQQLNS